MRRCFILLAFLICIFSVTTLHAGKKESSPQLSASIILTPHDLAKIIQPMKPDWLHDELSNFQAQQKKTLSNVIKRVERELAIQKDHFDTLLTFISIFVGSITLLTVGFSIHFIYNSKQELRTLKDQFEREITTAKQAFFMHEKEVAARKEEIFAAMKTSRSGKELDKDQLDKLSKASDSEDLPRHLILAAKATKAYASEEWLDAYNLYKAAAAEQYRSEYIISQAFSAMSVGDDLIGYDEENAKVWLGKALTLYLEELSKDNLSGADYTNLAFIHTLFIEHTSGEEQMSHITSAITYARKAVSIDPKDSLFLSNLAAALIWQGKCTKGKERQEAISDLRNAVKKAHKIQPGTAAYEMAQSYYLENDFTKCQNWLELGLKYDTLISAEDLASNEEFEKLYEEDWFKDIVSKLTEKEKSA